MIFELHGIYGDGTIEVSENNGSFSFGSTLERDVCPSCGEFDCVSTCKESEADKKESPEDIQQRLLFNLGIEVVESYTGALVIALREKGFNLEDENLKDAIKESIETVLDAIVNNAS